MKRTLFKISLAITIIITLVIGGGFIMIVFVIPHGVLTELKQSHCNGKIMRMYKEQSCFVNIEVQQQSDTTTLTVCECSADKSFFKYAAVGDSIVKEKDKFRLLVIRNNITREFNYPYCLE